jgi:methionyl-tRNA synthetase
METILYVTAEVLRRIGILVQPVMPTSAAKLLDQLGVPEDARSFADLGSDERLKPGKQFPPPQPVFPRYVEPDSEAAAS